MQKHIVIWVVVFGLLAAITASAWAEEWSLKADYAESCCCNAACPCFFGSPPTLGHCEFTGLVEIKEGHYGNVGLDGIPVVVTASVGQWVRYYVSEKATDEQAEAAGQLMTQLYRPLPPMEVLSTERVPVLIERDTTKVKFSVPASTVEMEMMKGMNGKPITIQNLALSWTVGYTQYRSVVHSHQSEDKEFSYSETNGLTARIDIASKN